MTVDGLPRPVTAHTKDDAWSLPIQWPSGQELPKRFSTWPWFLAPIAAEDEWAREKPLGPGDSSVTFDNDYGRDPEEGSHGRNACGWPVLPTPVNPATRLTKTQLRFQRAVFFIFILAVNLGLAALTLFAHVGVATLVIILFFKMQDCLSCIISIVCVTYTTIAGFFRKPEPVSRQWVLSLIPAYNESEEQILKAISSMRDNVSDPHRQVVVIVLDGHPKELRGEFSRIVAEFERPYHSLKYKSGTLKITAGFFQDLPVLLIEKVQNSGKKDSLVLTHDLFNHPRDNMPEYTRLLRDEIWKMVLPELTAGTGFAAFDMIFCTDADSLIHEGCMMKLIDRLARDERAIAACGLVLVEFEPGYKWSPWNFFQILQYAYGQAIRRMAEGFVGKVTCLPGCVTMIAVRPEMAGAIAKYARPVKENWVLHHQVQNLGTDRRLTYCMLSQDKKLRTLFVQDAVSETVAPQSFKHYLHQRRRWGSNAYFNNFFYCGGRNMILFTRFFALLQIMRQSCIYYRVLNTILFIRALCLEFKFMDILPLLIVGQFPLLWFLVCTLTQRALRVRFHQLFVGFIVNKIVSPIMSSIVFFAVMTNLGNAVWGLSGITASSAASASQRPSTKSSTASDPARPPTQSSTAWNLQRPPTQSSSDSDRRWATEAL